MSKTALIDAVRRLDHAAVRRLLDANPGLLAARDRRGYNLLHLACSASAADPSGKKRQVHIADALLSRGLPIDAPVGPDACTPLFFSVARARNTPLARFLIARGAEPSRAPGGGLFAAGWWQDLDALELLVRTGAAIDRVVGVTPFLACWCWGRFEAAKWLARHGADVNHRDSRGRTALHHGIAKTFDPPLLAWLVRHGASPELPDRQGESARDWAARKRDRRWLDALGPQRTGQRPGGADPAARQRNRVHR
ncbi:MAG: hypothetical protein FJ206_14365 [Gemmatimonadetes bacterium]|nr:hypothetical protein [Gemmatimonadota bacterium]